MSFYSFEKINYYSRLEVITYHTHTHSIHNFTIQHFVLLFNASENLLFYTLTQRANKSFKFIILMAQNCFDEIENRIFFFDFIAPESVSGINNKLFYN